MIVREKYIFLEEKHLAYKRTRAYFGVYTFCIYLWQNRRSMKNLSLKMDESVFHETEKITARIKRNRNRYINDAVRFYNELQKRKMLGRQLQKESLMVREESLKVLAEFEKFEDEA